VDFPELYGPKMANVNIFFPLNYFDNYSNYFLHTYKLSPSISSKLSPFYKNSFILSIGFILNSNKESGLFSDKVSNSLQNISIEIICFSIDYSFSFIYLSISLLLINLFFN